MRQTGQKPTPLMTSLTKKLKPNPPNLYCIVDSKTHRVFLGFYQLSSTIDWQVVELQSGVKIAANAELKVRYMHTPAAKVLRLSALELQAQKVFRWICSNFRGNVKILSFQSGYAELSAYKEMGCLMSPKMHFLHSHQFFFLILVPGLMRRIKDFNKVFKLWKQDTKGFKMYQWWWTTAGCCFMMIFKSYLKVT